MSSRPERQLLVIAVAAVVLCGVAGVLVQQTPQALAAPEGVPDTGRLMMETNAKLDQLNATLKDNNAKLQELVELFKSGKVEVVAHSTKVSEAERK